MEDFLYAHIISGINLASYQLTSIQLCSPEGIPWIKFEKLNIKIRISLYTIQLVGKNGGSSVTWFSQIISLD